MAKPIPYRGYTIEATSYQVLEPAGWMAQALIISDRHGEVHHVPISDRQARRFGSREEADALAIQLARAWIEERG